MDTLPSSYGIPVQLNEEIDRQLTLAKDLIKLAKSQKVQKLGAYVKRVYRPDLDLVALALADFQLKTNYIPENEGVHEGFFKELDDYVMWHIFLALHRNKCLQLSGAVIEKIF